MLYTFSFIISKLSLNFVHLLLGYIPQSPENPMTTQHTDDKSNTDTSCCNSPSSILSTASIANTTTSLQFPTPSPSPYQHASENILTTRDNNTFYTDFLDYKPYQEFLSSSSSSSKKPLQQQVVFQDDDEKEKETKTSGGGKIVNSELKRQIHIQSEQKRRAQIKDGFEDLRNELPSCLNKKLSKVALLHRSKYTVSIHV